jgi:ABC-type polysaccharide/polyol phosphate transport system ATPase subunit
MSDFAIRVEGVSKQFRIGASPARYATLRDTIANMATAPLRAAKAMVHRDQNDADAASHFWALKDVSFDVRPGEVIGLIGRNGAGKSTMLKILTRITEPTEGWAEIRGRVGSLLEVGTGFHPELTGRENVYLNGAILGMGRAEINARFDEIVAFAEVDRFIDTPVKHYSSGMYLRLAFAVAAHLQPEVLLVDEVLAVGDSSFQEKCLGKMGDVAKEGRTVVFVSHNMVAVNLLCERVVWLSEGHVRAIGPAAQIVRDYLLERPASRRTNTAAAGKSGQSATAVTLHSVDLTLQDDATPRSAMAFNSPIVVRIPYDVNAALDDFRIAVSVQDLRGIDVFESWITDKEKPDPRPFSVSPGTYRSTCVIPPRLLLPGSYNLKVTAFIPKRGTLDQLDDLRFAVTEEGYYDVFTNRYGVVAPLLGWNTEKT